MRRNNSQPKGKKKANAQGRAKQQQNKTTKPRRQRRAKVKPKFQLSKCSELYVRALADPFSKLVGQVCIPDLYDSPSKKSRTLCRGFVSVGATAANGFVLIDPLALGTNDSFGVFQSNASYVTDGFPTLPTTTGVQATTNQEAPYGRARIGNAINSVQYRVVAAGLRVRYSGSELNRGGRIIPFRHPQNRAFTSYTTAEVLAFNEVNTLECDRKWHAIGYLPVSATDYSYTSVAPAANPDPGLAGSIGFLVTASGAATALTYEWEAVLYMEYTGAVEDATASHSDVPGMSAIRNFFEGGFDGEPSTNFFQEVMKGVSALGPKDISGYVSAGAKVLEWV